jgi:hypothetical protein
LRKTDWHDLKGLALKKSARVHFLFFIKKIKIEKNPAILKVRKHALHGTRGRGLGLLPLYKRGLINMDCPMDEFLHGLRIVYIYISTSIPAYKYMYAYSTPMRCCLPKIIIINATLMLNIIFESEWISSTTKNITIWVMLTLLIKLYQMMMVMKMWMFFTMRCLATYRGRTIHSFGSKY